MKTIQDIDREITKLKRQLEKVEGTETEIYTRIVGYYRSLKNWNKGKKEEYTERLHFKTPEQQIDEGVSEAFEESQLTSDQSAPLSLAPKEPLQEKSASEEFSQAEGPENTDKVDINTVSRFRYFYRKACPRCKPVKQFLDQLNLAGEKINVDTEEGLKQAQADQILSTPTVIFFDHNNNVLYRKSDPKVIRELFEPVSCVL